MKYLVSKQKAVNLNNVIDFFISDNHLVLSTTDGREMRFVYGAPEELARLFDEVVAFLEEERFRTLDCDKFLGR